MRACTSCAPSYPTARGAARPTEQCSPIALGLSVGASPDRFLVGLAVLSLVSEVAEERPLLCIIDDAQWLDRATARTLAFVARAAPRQPVGFVFATRDPGEDLEGLPSLEPRGSGKPTQTPSSRQPFASQSTPVFATGSWQRRTGTHWRCSSSREA